MPIFSKANAWGGQNLSRLLYDYLLETLPKGKTILELGSGWSTGELLKHWNVWSIESEPEWHKKYYHDQSILVPITEKGGWYDYDTMKDTLYDLRGKYDLLLVDGPYYNREGVADYFYLFDQTTPVLFDDIRQEDGRKIMTDISEWTKRPYTIHGAGHNMFGEIE
jgi:hypothetical protein